MWPFAFFILNFHPFLRSYFFVSSLKISISKYCKHYNYSKHRILRLFKRLLLESFYGMIDRHLLHSSVRKYFWNREFSLERKKIFFKYLSIYSKNDKRKTILVSRRWSSTKYKMSKQEFSMIYHPKILVYCVFDILQFEKSKSLLNVFLFEISLIARYSFNVSFIGVQISKVAVRAS